MNLTLIDFNFWFSHLSVMSATESSSVAGSHKRSMKSSLTYPMASLFFWQWYNSVFKLFHGFTVHYQRRKRITQRNHSLGERVFSCVKADMIFSPVVCGALLFFSNWNLIIWLSSISLMYMRNRSGSNTEPWGTPLVNGCQFEEIPLKTTRCFIELNQPLTHSTILESIPIDCIFISSLSWGIESKALLKSR